MPFRAFLTAAVSAVTVVFVLALASPASAHDVLASTAPAADSSVSGDLDEVSLTFSEPPLAGLESGIVISVTAPGGTEVGSGKVAVAGSTLSTAADLTARGPYTVTWRSVSVDGHPISGSYRFTSAGATAPSDAATTPVPSATPTASTGSPPATAAPVERSAADSNAPVGPGATPWVLGGIAVLVAAVLVGALLVVRRRPSTTD